MAYAALVSLSQTIHLILDYHQDSIAPQVKHEIISINEHVIFLQDFLDHFPDKANTLEAIIRAITHVAEDIIELFMSEHVHEPRYNVLDSSIGPPERLRPDLQNEDYCSVFRLQTEIAQDVVELYFREMLCALVKSSGGPSNSKFKHQSTAQYEHLCYDFHDLREATEEIQSIAEMVMKMKSRIIAKDDINSDATAVNNSSSSRVAPVYKDAMVGFENDTMEIKSRLCRESSKLEVVPIVGMGGIGKTTLARNVYDDPLITEHFQIHVWITVSQDYSIKEIVSCLLISMKLYEARSESMREEHVYQHLKGRRYLIVMDDIWSVEAWDDLKLMFPDDGNGSRIMITTRLTDVATYADSVSPLHEMHLMDMDLSWDLLRQRVFKKEQCPVTLEYAGKVIARSCRGLPLAIVVISGVLSSIDQTAAAWDNIAKNVTTLFSVNNEQFDKILSLSYTHLPHYLRPCFLYMGRFPEDYKVRASKLIKLWVAEGFLKPNACNKSSEEMAEEYLEDLVKRSLVLVTQRKSNGRIKNLSMHDLLREMCIRISKEEKFLRLGPVSSRQGISIPYHVRMFPTHIDFHESIYGLNTRTILLSGNAEESALVSLQNFKLLRILDLLEAYTPPLPTQVLELFRLRYLAFYGYFSIPAGILNLQNLQTLIIDTYPSYHYFPYCLKNYVPFLLEIWSMPQLRHVIIRSGFCFCLPPLPHQEGEIFRLENLQTLSLVMNFISTPEILKTIPNLKKLEILYGDSRDDEQDYQLHNLIHLQHLENLKLRIHSEFSSPDKVYPALPRTLKKLSLSGMGLSWEDMEIVGSLPCLQVLKLRDYTCYGDTWETNEGEFSELKFLLIDESELQNWITESSHFPKLVCLVLHHCWDLIEIPNDIGEVPTLELIEVDDEYLLDSAKQIQEEQQSCGNDAIRVRFAQGSKKAETQF